MALLLVTAVVPTLQIIRRGLDEDIAFLLAGFKIILSDDRKEVVRIVSYYMWCVEGKLSSCRPAILNISIKSEVDLAVPSRCLTFQINCV